MIRFRERLVPGLGTAAAVLLLAPAVLVVLLPIAPFWLGATGAVVAVVAAEALLWGRSPVIEVTDGMLRAGRAHIGVSLTGEVRALHGEAAREARGIGLDARAWTLLRGWVDPVVRVEITDRTDPAPYWVVSTRRPEELAAALSAARVSD